MVRLAAYLVRMMAPWLALSLMGAAVVFVASQAVRVAPVFMGLDHGAWRIAQAIGLLLVPVTGWALTPAFAIGVLAVFGRMSAGGEQLALDGAGIPRWKCAAGPAILALVLAAASGWIWLDASWRSQGALRELSLEMAGEALVGRFAEGSFMSPARGITFFAGEGDGRDGEFGAVMIEDARDPARSRQIFARRAALDFDPGAAGVAIRMEDGRMFVEPGLDGRPAAIGFEELEVFLDVSGELEESTGFIPRLMSVPTARLAGGDLGGLCGFAFWRRVAGPVGFLAVAFAALVLALVPRWRRTWSATVAGGGLFAAYHILGRLAEPLATEEAAGPAAAAFLPAGALVVTAAVIVLANVARRAAPGRDC